MNILLISAAIIRSLRMKEWRIETEFLLGKQQRGEMFAGHLHLAGH